MRIATPNAVLPGTLIDTVGTVSVSGTNITVGAASTTSYLSSHEWLCGSLGCIFVAKIDLTYATPAAGLVQYVGIGTSGSGYFFGYNGTSFGISLRTGGIAQISTVTITSGTATLTTGSVTVTLDGKSVVTSVPANQNISAVIALVAAKAYAGWSVTVVGNTLQFVSNTCGQRPGTFSVVATGATATMTNRVTGVNITETFVPMSSWSVDSLSTSYYDTSTVTPTNRIVIRITQHLQSALTTIFWLLDQSTDNFLPVHRVTELPTKIPARPLTIVHENTTTSASNMIVTSLNGYAYGDIPSGALFSASNNAAVSAAASTITHAFTLRNEAFIGTLANSSCILLRKVYVTSESSKALMIYLFKNSAIANRPAAGFSFSSTDPASTVVTSISTAYSITSGQLVATLGVAPNASAELSVADLGIVLTPGDELNFGCQAVQPALLATANLFISCRWVEAT